MQYPAHAAFVAPARGYPQLWRLVLGIVASVGTFFVMMGLLFGLVSLGPGGIAGAEAWMRSDCCPGLPGRLSLNSGVWKRVGVSVK